MRAKRAFLATILAATLASPAVSAQTGEVAHVPTLPEVPYVPTPPEVVQRMLQLGRVASGDVVYDLGCGDGRIVIAAVQTPGVRGVCVEIDLDRINEARRNAETAGVADRIRFVQEDLFKVPIQDATVVTLYLLPNVNLRLRPRLLSELRPGTRIVSHAFDMGDWQAEQRVVVETAGQHYVIYSWTVPVPQPTTR